MPKRRRTTRKDRLRRDLEAEIAAHLEMRTEQLIDEGLDPDTARREALKRFGDADAPRRRAEAGARTLARSRRQTEWLTGVARWGRHTVRRALRAPGFTTVSLLIYALAVGLATFTFMMADHVLVRPLPLSEPEQLVALQGVDERGAPVSRVSMGNWVDWKHDASTLTSTALYRTRDATLLVGDDEASRVSATVAHGPFFSTLGMPVAAGRPLTEADGREGAAVVVISRPLWVSVFGADPDLTSLDLRVNGRRVDVVGVVEPERAFPATTQIWIPAPYGAESGAMRNNINYEAVARLAPGATPEQAARDLTGIARGIHEREPEAIYSYGVHVVPLREIVVGAARGWLRLLAGAVVFVVLVACANLAGLSLARNRRRAHESAVRLALGAGRVQLAADRLAEHVLTALIGGALGVLLAAAAAGSLLRLFVDHLPRSPEVGFDGRVVAFGLLVSLAAGLATGVVPALAGSRSIAPDLTTGGRGPVRGGRRMPGVAMVGTEVALAVLLLVGGGLLLRSLLAVASRDLGFDPERVVVLDIALTAPEYQDLDARLAYWHGLLDDLGRDPQIAEIALGNWIPTGGGGTSFIELEERPTPNRGAGYRVVSDDYFDALGIPVLGGRPFGSSDTRDTERVGLVNQAAARAFWPGEDPVGKRIKAPSMEAYFNGGTAGWIRVVGTVGDVLHHGPEDEARPELFVLYRQMPAFTGSMSVVARLRPGAPAATLARLREQARAHDARLPVAIGTLAGRVRALLSERALVVGVLGTFAAVSVLLVCLGIYGLVSFAVSARTREIAVRSALGARRHNVVAMIVGDAGRVALAGSVVGLALALLFRQALAAMVVDVATTDPLSYLAAGGLVLASALAAALVPALRAARLDPRETLTRR